MCLLMSSKLFAWILVLGPRLVQVADAVGISLVIIQTESCVGRNASGGAINGDYSYL